MLTSFFGNSKPVNFTFVAVYMLAFFLISGFSSFDFTSVDNILNEILVLVLFLLGLLVFNFIAKRNELTRRNAYKTALFGAFSCMLIPALQNGDVVIANFFVLLATRRILSLRTQRETRKKIFDASFWIFIASLFYFWSVLFLFLVYFGIFFHVRRNVKYWLVPVIAFLTVLSLATIYDLLLNDSFFRFSEWFQETELDFSTYNELRILLPVSLLLALTVWTCFFYFGVVQKASAHLKASHSLIVMALGLSVAVAFLAPTKNSSELLFYVAPLSIIVTNYLQGLEDKWFKDALLLSILLLPWVLLIFL